MLLLPPVLCQIEYQESIVGIVVGITNIKPSYAAKRNPRLIRTLFLTIRAPPNNEHNKWNTSHDIIVCLFWIYCVLFCSWSPCACISFFPESPALCDSTSIIFFFFFPCYWTLSKETRAVVMMAAFPPLCTPFPPTRLPSLSLFPLISRFRFPMPCQLELEKLKLNAGRKGEAGTKQGRRIGFWPQGEREEGVEQEEERSLAEWIPNNLSPTTTQLLGKRACLTFFVDTCWSGRNLNRLSLTSLSLWLAAGNLCFSRHTCDADACISFAHAPVPVHPSSICCAGTCQRRIFFFLFCVTSWRISTSPFSFLTPKKKKVSLFSLMNCLLLSLLFKHWNWTFLLIDHRCAPGKKKKLLPPQ